MAVGVGDPRTASVLTGIAIVVLRGFRWVEEAWDRRRGRSPVKDDRFEDD
jgi:hypothetical protein